MIMKGIAEHDIDKMLDSYRKYDEELQQIMEIMESQCVEATLGYVHNYWNKRQRKNMLRHFRHTVAKRDKLRCDIHYYYMNKIDGRSEEKSRAILSPESIESKKLKNTKSPIWNHSLASLSRERAAFNGKKLPKFSQLIEIMRMRFRRNS